MKTAAIYGRVSTTDQSCEMQQRDLRQLAERRELQVAQEYFDNGVSGTRASRPALDQMLQDAKRGKFQVLLIWRLDRLGRSLSHLIRLMEDLRAWNIELISYSEGLDFSTATGKLMYQLLGAFAEFERNSIIERVRAGQQLARRKGVRFGRPRISIDREQITQLRARGASWRAISAQTGVSKDTLIRNAS